MNKLIRKSATPIGALIATVLFLVFAIVFSNSVVTHAGDGTQSQPGRLLTVHDRGSEKVILSQAATVGDALKEAGIVIDAKDVVEPAAEVKLVASDYQVNIYRARPVMIIDGNIRQKVVSPYQTAEQIAKSVGIVLYPEDITTIDRVNNITEGTGLQLTIDRATPFIFNLYGKTSTVRTQGTTVGEMLIEKGIKLSADDKVSPSQDTAVTDGLAVRVWREGKQTVTVDEDVNFEVETIKDADMEIGYHAVRTLGEKGSRSVTYEVTIQDGQEVSRVEIASLTIKIPNNQIEIIGAKYKTFGGTCSEWMANAGITDVSSASELIRRESNCNPYSVNSTSGACGVGQALPCSKSGCEMGDGACQMIWMNQYVISRYGTWANALAHSYSYGWY